MKIKPVRDWEWERYLLEELPSQRMQEISDLLEKDSDLRGHVAAMKNSSAQILALYPPRNAASVIERKIEEKKIEAEVFGAKQRIFGIFPKKSLYALPVLAAAFILVFVVLQDPRVPSSRDRQGTFQQGTRIKGEEDIDMSRPQIIVYRKLGEQAEVVKNGDPASKGDLFQIAYVPAGNTYGVIFSIDGNKVVTLHYPDRAGELGDLMQENKVLLDSAYELDDAPHFERFFFVASTEKIDVQAILELAHELARSPESARTENLILPKTFTQFSILLNKEKDNGR